VSICEQTNNKTNTIVILTLMYHI